MGLVSYVKSNYKNLKNHINTSKKDQTDVKVSFNFDNLESIPDENSQDKKHQKYEVETTKLKANYINSESHSQLSMDSSFSKSENVIKPLKQNNNSIIPALETEKVYLSNFEENKMKSISYSQAEKKFNDLKEPAESNTGKVFNTHSKASGNTAQVVMILEQFIEELIIEEMTMDGIINDLMASVADNETDSPCAYKAIKTLINQQEIKTQVINKLMQGLEVLLLDTKNPYTDELLDYKAHDFTSYELSASEFFALQEASMLLGNNSE